MPEMTIVLVDGQVCHVEGLEGSGYKILVRDYDIPGDWNESDLEEYTLVDDAGDRYQEYEVR